MALDDRRRLETLLRLRGAALPQPLDADALAALERCKKCNYKKLCDEFIAAPVANGARMFCPNCHYIEACRQKGLAFTP